LASSSTSSREVELKEDIYLFFDFRYIIIF